MCGRYASTRRPEDLIEEFDLDPLPEVDLPRLEPDWNVAPTKEVYAVLQRDRRELRTLTWGLVPFWAKDPAIGSRMINARMETVAEKPAYRRPFERRRCLLPADGYYEWYETSRTNAQKNGRGKPVKQPFFIRPTDEGVLAMAGLYEIWRDPDGAEDDPDRFRWTCTVITTTAEDSLGRIHERMPLMVDHGRYAEWLDPAVSDRERLLGLLTPAAPGRLEAYPVAPLVSNVKNNGPELVEPLPVADG